MVGCKSQNHGGKMENTKDNIMYQALTLFSERGFEGVSMRDIASKVGIKAASLYNHFKSKEDIFNSIIEEMSRRYEEMFMKMQVPHGDMNTVVEKYMHVTEDDLTDIANKVFLYFLKDEFASKFRRMLTIEQFRSTIAGDVFQNFFIEGAIGFESTLFKNMIREGAFIDCDPYVMALHFYSPMFLLLSKYDRMTSVEEEKEAFDILKRHVKQFSKVYSNKNKNPISKNKSRLPTGFRESCCTHNKGV